MNYLGHLMVLPDAGLTTLGNLLGDFFKGRVTGIAPIDLRVGVALHREIDRFTDRHPVVQRSVSRIDPQRRRVAAVLVDVFYDHFLAQGVDIDALRPDLLAHAAHLPEDLRGLPGRMLTTGWLGSYASIEGIAMVLKRMQQRRKRIVGLEGAEVELHRHHEALAADVREFFPEVQQFTREALPRIQWACQAVPVPDVAVESVSGPLQSA